MLLQQFLANLILPLRLKRFAAIRCEAKMAAKGIHGGRKRYANSFVTGLAFTSSRGWLR